MVPAFKGDQNVKVRWLGMLLLSGLLFLHACGDGSQQPASEPSLPSRDSIASEAGSPAADSPEPEAAPAPQGSLHLFVDPRSGSDRGEGTRGAPLASIGEALRRLPRVVTTAVTIELAPGRYGSWGEDGATLELEHPMRVGGRVRITGKDSRPDAHASEGVVLDWETPGFLVSASRGEWVLDSLQIGRNRSGQTRGVDVSGSALVELRDVRIRTGSVLGPGIRARHGGRIHLAGEILLNEHLRYASPLPDTFASITAQYGGLIRFIQREGASLTLGNGNLDARYYGIIELGCEQAAVTSWSERWNTIAVNNSGRIDLHGSTLRVAAPDPRNTPIGLEGDGHVLAEGAHIVIEANGNKNGIVLQKASSLFADDVKIEGRLERSLIAMSGSHLHVRVQGDLEEIVADTGATIVVQKLDGRLIGPVRERAAGRVVLPAGVARESLAGYAPTPPSLP